MVMKIFAAATCVAAMAGGMVYFGGQPTDGSGSVRIESNATDGVEISDTNKIVSRYITTETTETVTEHESGFEDVEGNPYVVDASEHPHPPKRKNKTDSKENEAEIIDPEQILPEPAEAETEALIEEAEASERDGNLETEQTVEEIEIVEFVEPGRMRDNDKIEMAEETRSAEPRRRRKPRLTNNSDANDPAMQRINVVFEQAENIRQPDLRDRAYLDLSDYATSKGLFGEAEKAALKIRQVELRDTARSRIAMGLARYGKSDEAFDLIEDVEVQELRDVMRLQVIEALLGTDGRR